MIIGINIYDLIPGKIGGQEQYVRSLINKFSTLKQCKVYIFTNRIAYSTFEKNESLYICLINEFEDKNTQMFFFIDYYNIELLFCPLLFMAPEYISIPTIVNIPDIQHEFYPQYFSLVDLINRKRKLKNTIDNAAGIITISEFSKSTIQNKYNITNLEKIKVIYLDADICFTEPINEEKKKKWEKKLNFPYILYPANDWPHKNHKKLIQAYLILKKKYHTDLKLVFTGSSLEKNYRWMKYVKKFRLEQDIICLGYVSQEDMPYVFANAQMLVFPSLFEGFGIPLVEAMKSGIPIACSNCGSISEIAGDAAIIFNPRNAEDIAGQINRLAKDSILRSTLVRKGTERAKFFSWDKYFKEFVQYFEEIYNKNKINEYERITEEYPLVSIITPSYNQGQFIEETIKSVLQQDYCNIEYIVIDGGSTDQTLDILRRYSERIKWISEPDKGQGDAVNKGIQMACGSIIGWLNSDDTYIEGAVSSVVSYFNNHHNTSMVYGEAYYTNERGKIIGRYLTEKFSTLRLAEQCFICQPATFFTKEIFERSGKINQTYQLSMDYELWMRIAKLGKIAYLPKYLATSRMYKTNKTLSRKREAFQESFKALKKHYNYIPIEWLAGRHGYVAFMFKTYKGFVYYFIVIVLFLRYNLMNPKYILQQILIRSRKCLRRVYISIFLKDINIT